MTLIIGGAHSGKREYAIRTLGFDEKDMSSDINSDADVICDLHLMLRETEDEAALLTLLKGKKAVICDEVGCGIIPADEHDRCWRERVGRVCCELAASADKVVRLNCGIASVIKGEGVP